MSILPNKYANELIPGSARMRNVVSDELVQFVMFVGHVAVVTQVTVVTHSALPANTTYVPRTTTITSDVLVTHT